MFPEGESVIDRCALPPLSVPSITQTFPWKMVLNWSAVLRLPVATMTNHIVSQGSSPA
jgi:hypothetical protein